MKQNKRTLTIFLVFLFAVTAVPGLGAESSVTASAEKSLGRVNFPISCSSAAQTRFNKGLALLHNMMYLQAQKEFEEVATFDPECAMAHWGISMTLFHPLWAPPSKDELIKGRKAIQIAEALKPPTSREKAYITAANAFYTDWESVDHHARIASWEKVQKKVYEENPGDIDAGALYALAHLATAPKGDKTFAHQKEAGALLERLREKAAEHPGLFHYTIHAYDNPMFASRGLDVAREYDKIAPDAPHAQHMPSHIFVRLGLWSLTEEWNVRSADAARRQSKPGELSLHYIHAMDYLMYAYLQTAKDDMAQNALTEINGVERYQDSFASAYALAAAPARYVLERRQWGEAAKLKPLARDTFRWENYPWYEAINYFARGIGAARSGDTAGAIDAVKTLDRLYDRSVKEGQDYWAVLVDSKRKTVTAWIAYSDGEKNKALELMKIAADTEDSVDKHPVTPGAVLPARELLGDMLVLTGRYNEAVKAYEASLRISPNRFNSLYGAGRASELAGNLTEANQYYSRLIELASGVNSERPRLIKAKAFLAGS